MTSLFSKARSAVLGNLHSLLDKAIDLNAMPVVQQYVRDLEGATEDVADSLAVARGRASQTQSDIQSLKTQITTTDGNIALLLGDDDPSNDKLAEQLEARMIGFETKLKQMEQLQVDQDQVVSSLEEAERRLRGKLSEMKDNLARLEAMETATKAKEQASAALRSAGKAGSVDASASVDSVERRMKDRSAVANARFERALGDMAESVDVGVVAAQAKERIAARKAKKPEAATEPATTS